MPRRFAALAVLLAFAAVPSYAEPASQRSARRTDSGCDDGWNDSRRASYCEMREETISGLNPLDVDAGQNGGIQVRGWDRNDVLVRARIRSYAGSDADARRIVSERFERHARGAELVAVGGVDVTVPEMGAETETAGEIEHDLGIRAGFTARLDHGTPQLHQRLRRRAHVEADLEALALERG